MTLKDLLTVDDVARSAHLQSLSKATGEKALLIPDYISKPKGSIDDEEDLINFSSMGSQAHLVLRSKTKPRVDQVTLAMYCGSVPMHVFFRHWSIVSLTLVLPACSLC